jgi:hypothetical protein
MRSRRRPAGRSKFVFGQSVTLGITWMFRPDRRRQIDAVIDYFGEQASPYDLSREMHAGRGQGEPARADAGEQVARRWRG